MVSNPSFDIAESYAPQESGEPESSSFTKSFRHYKVTMLMMHMSGLYLRLSNPQRRINQLYNLPEVTVRRLMT